MARLWHQASMPQVDELENALDHRWARRLVMRIIVSVHYLVIVASDVQTYRWLSREEAHQLVEKLFGTNVQVHRYTAVFDAHVQYLFFWVVVVV